MHVEFAFYGTLRDAVGETSVVRNEEKTQPVSNAVVLAPGVAGRSGAVVAG